MNGRGVTSGKAICAAAVGAVVGTMGGMAAAAKTKGKEAVHRLRARCG